MAIRYTEPNYSIPTKSATEFRSWADSNPGVDILKQYGAERGLTPTDMARMYNSGGNGGVGAGVGQGQDGYVSAEQAAQWLGVSSPSSQLYANNYYSNPNVSGGANSGGGQGGGLQNVIGQVQPNYQWNPYDANGNVQFFQPNLFPVSTSGGQSQSTGNSGSNSFSGLDEATRQAILGAVMPSLTKSVTGILDVPEKYANDATKLYEEEARKSLESTLPQVLEAMGVRNILNSSVSENAQADATSQIISDMAQKIYESKMKAGEQELAIPAILGQLIGLGNYSQGKSESQNMSDSANYSVSADPGEAYTNYANILTSLSPYLIGTQTNTLSSMGDKGFYDWANSKTGTDAIAQWARSNGYSASQLADAYNRGGNLKPGDTGYITKEQAAQMLAL